MCVDNGFLSSPVSGRKQQPATLNLSRLCPQKPNPTLSKMAQCTAWLPPYLSVCCDTASFSHTSAMSLRWKVQSLRVMHWKMLLLSTNLILESLLERRRQGGAINRCSRCPPALEPKGSFNLGTIAQTWTLNTAGLCSSHSVTACSTSCLYTQDLWTSMQVSHFICGCF